MKIITEFICDEVSYRVVTAMVGHRLQASTQATVWTTLEDGQLQGLLRKYGVLVRDAITRIPSKIEVPERGE